MRTDPLKHYNESELVLLLATSKDGSLPSSVNEHIAVCGTCMQTFLKLSESGTCTRVLDDLDKRIRLSDPAVSPPCVPDELMEPTVVTDRPDPRSGCPGPHRKLLVVSATVADILIFIALVGFFIIR